MRSNGFDRKMNRNTNENYALLLAKTLDGVATLAALSKRIGDCKCEILEANVARLGSSTVVALHIIGTWSAIAKIETAVAKLQTDDTQIVLQRAPAKADQANLLLYMIEVVAADRSNALHQIAEFFQHHHISVERLALNRYNNSQTGAPMLSATLTIGVPATTHLASLREDFLEFCDALNLDAVLEPARY